eukprot:3961628-Amphidinium_carterae.2
MQQPFLSNHEPWRKTLDGLLNAQRPILRVSTAHDLHAQAKSCSEVFVLFISSARDMGDTLHHWEMN